MYCDKCGKKIENGQLFCPYCGTKIKKEDASTDKKARKLNVILFVIIGILVLFIIMIIINFLIFNKKHNAKGEFKKVDGIDTYYENDSIVKNSLVFYKGKKYFVDDEGHKKKNAWEIIDNDGHYGYFGSLGEIITGTVKEIDGINYYFDEEGILATDIKIEYDGEIYYADENGGLSLINEEDIKQDEVNTKAATVQATVPPTTKAVIQQTYATQVTTQATYIPPVVTTQGNYAAQAPVSNVVTPETTISANTSFSNMPTTEELIQQAILQEQQSKAAAASMTPGGSSTSIEQNGPAAVYPVVKGYEEGKSVDDDGSYDDDDDDDTSGGELKISGTEKITDVYDDDDYQCNITLLQPIVKGGKSGEADIINDCINDAMDSLFDEVDDMIGEYESLPKSVTFSSATISTNTSSRFVITLSGKLTPRSGSSKTIKYKMTYNREDEDMELTKA